jgi:hypothetical protein
MCDEAACAMVTVLCSFWLLLESNHCNFNEILGPLSSFIYVAVQLWIRIYTIMLPVVSRGHTTLCLTVREEYSLEPKKVEVTGDWTKLHDKELHDWDSSTNLIWLIKWLSFRACRAYRRGDMPTGFLWENLKVRLLGIPRCRWTYNIRMDFEDRGW